MAKSFSDFFAPTKYYYSNFGSVLYEIDTLKRLQNDDNNFVGVRRGQNVVVVRLTAQKFKPQFRKPTMEKLKGRTILASNIKI